MKALNNYAPEQRIVCGPVTGLRFNHVTGILAVASGPTLVTMQVSGQGIVPVGRFDLGREILAVGFAASDQPVCGHAEGRLSVLSRSGRQESAEVDTLCDATAATPEGAISVTCISPFASDLSGVLSSCRIGIRQFDLSGQWWGIVRGSEENPITGFDSIIKSKGVEEWTDLMLGCADGTLVSGSISRGDWVWNDRLDGKGDAVRKIRIARGLRRVCTILRASGAMETYTFSMANQIMIPYRTDQAFVNDFDGVTFGSDETYGVLLGREDGVVDMHNLGRGTENCYWQAHPGPITGVAFLAPHSDLIATGGADGVRVWKRPIP